MNKTIIDAPERINDLQKGKIYQPWQIALATFLGGPLAGAYALTHNYRQIGETRYIRTVWVLCILLLLLSFVLAIMLLTHNFPCSIVPLVYTSILFSTAQSQRAKIQDFITEGGKVYAAIQPIFVGLVSLTLTIVAIFAFVFALMGIFPEEFAR